MITERVTIPTPDGETLAGVVRRPEGDTPVAGVIEANPYRSSDWTFLADAPRHTRFVDSGYASLRLDLRGSGNSTGVLSDEYTAQEQDDIITAIEWLAERRWCTGRIGMIGISWGGFACLQVAARRPPALQAIVAVCATDDRHRDDVHYFGGGVLAEWSLSWAVTMTAYNARPPDPAVVGDQWRAMWEERLEHLADLGETWFGHQRRDDYWRHGSVAEDYGSIQCPVYLATGWADGYPDATLRLVEHLTVPRKAVIGPWGHQYPDNGVPGPAIGFADECVKWWQQWLDDRPSGVLDDAPLRVWIPDPGPQRASFPSRPGHWLELDGWPASAVVERDVELAPPTEAIPSTLLPGAAAGSWSDFGSRAGAPGEQSADDVLSLCADTDPLTEDIEICGVATVHVCVRSDEPIGTITVRLCDVAPDGTSTLISRGALALTRREGPGVDEVVPMPTDEPVRVEVPVRSAAYRVPEGHRVRVALAASLWPWTWPPAATPALALHERTLTLRLPVVEGPEALTVADPYPPIVRVPRPAHRVHTPPSGGRRRAPDRSEETANFDTGLIELADGVRYGESGETSTFLVDGDPLSARARSRHSTRVSRDGWTVDTDVIGELTATETDFVLTMDVDVVEDGVRRAVRRFDHRIPRDLL